MKRNKNKLIILAVAMIILGSCSKQLDELLVNPNTPTIDNADADLYLNTVQGNFTSFYYGASDFGMQVTRQITMAGPAYRNAYGPESFNGLWSSAYTGVFKHCDALIPIASTNKQWVNVAMAKIMKAHTMMTLVDFFGEIPFLEANKGTDNTNPAVDKGSVTYAAAIALLDEAVVDLAKPIGKYPGLQDVFFGTTATNSGVTNWRTTAKLLKLRALVATRLVNPGAKDAINTLIADADVVASVGSSARDFEFKYSTKQANPDSRHPRYGSNYQPTGQAADYIGTTLLWALAVEKGTGDASNDPRTRYYIYRQQINYALADENSYPCTVQARPPQFPATMPFCKTVSGFWGRDHGDNSGTPPDGNLRSTVGIYPCGGEFDANQSTQVSLNRGGQGAGIEPMWQSAFTEFIKAECALTIGTNGNPRTLLENGIRRSMDKVSKFPAAIGAALSVPTAYAMTQARIDGYVNKVLVLYDAAPTTDAKLEVIGKEYWLALWGNGIETYNLYRRTGKPGNLQLTLLPNPGSFARSMFYPADYVNLNNNAVQKSDVNVQVYWDNNPPDFIK